MDFIEGLPKSDGNEVIFIVLDRFSKNASWLLLILIQPSLRLGFFIDNVYKLYDLPATIVSDKDSVFVSRFWKISF
jgi:hypothetical protein